MKVFGIGLSKTGTTSLNEALGILGLKSKHYFFNLDQIEELDAATDLPIARAFRELDSYNTDAQSLYIRRISGTYPPFIGSRFRTMISRAVVSAAFVLQSIPHQIDLGLNFAHCSTPITNFLFVLHAAPFFEVACC